MSQHDYVIANGTGAAVRSDLNNALAAIVSNNSGSTEPATTYAYQWWADTTANQLKLRNAANSAWITIQELDGTMLMEDGSAASPGLAFASDLDTGFFRAGTNQLGIATNGTVRLTATTTAITSALPVDVLLGSASTPSYTFTGDLNTGIYSPGADQIAIATAGVDRFKVEADGDVIVDGGTVFVDATNNRVGIGTSTTRAGLTVGLGSSTIPAAGASTAAAVFGNATDAGSYGVIVGANGSGTGYIQAQQVNGNTTTYDLAIQPNGGRVGIGTTSPSRLLHLSAADSTSFSSADFDQTYNFLRIVNTTNDKATGIYFGIGTNGEAAITAAETSDGETALVFGTRGGGARSERARLDSSGRLLVGTSSAPSVGDSQYALVSIQGNTTGSTGDSFLSLRRGQAPASISSGAGLGTIVFGANDGSPYATIAGNTDGSGGSGDYPGRLVFSTTADAASSPTERFRIFSDGNARFSNLTDVYPNTDNAVRLGASGLRWSQVWAANGTIQTSDERAKVNIADATLGSDFIKSLRPVSFRWIEGGKRDTDERDENNNYIYESVPGKRTHWGFIAQEVKQAVDDAGVDFGGWVLTDKDDPDSQQALRYDQFIAPLTKALQEALTEIDVLKAKVAALESA